MSDTPMVVGKLLDRKEEEYVQKPTGQEIKDLEPVTIEYPGMKDGTEEEEKKGAGMVTINGIAAYDDDMSQFTKDYREEDPFVQKIRAFKPEPFVPPDDLLDDSTVSSMLLAFLLPERYTETVSVADAHLLF
jgi:hypothetical protein